MSPKKSATSSPDTISTARSDVFPPRPGSASLSLLTLLCVLLPIVGGAGASHAKSLNRRIEIGTEVPVQVGLGLILEHPGSRLWWRGSVGFVPPGYVTLANEVTQQFEPDYTDPTADLVVNTLERSLVLRTGVGWWPFQKSGFTFGIGYTLVTLGGGSTTQEVIEGVYGIRIDDRFLPADERNLSTEATLHMADFMLGWDLDLGKRTVLRLSLGWSYTFSSSATVEAEFTADRNAGNQAIAQLEEATEEYLSETFRNYVHPVQVGISLGWRW
jgi:hypothetical protein